MKGKFFFLFFLITISFQGVNLFAQSNSVIDTLLNEDKADLGRTAYMVFSAASLVDDSAEIPEVLDFLKLNGWKNLEQKAAGDTITLGEYSYLVTKAFDIKGGIMYRLFPGPRYAARELKYMGFVDNDADPSMPVTGDAVIRILGYVLEWKEGQK